MDKIFKFGALAVFLGTVGVAHADLAETKGGVTIKTDDGRFEAKIGGRIHLDATSLDNDDSGTYSTEGGAYFRRARLTLSGKAYGWEYKFENDFADADAATAVECEVEEPTPGVFASDCEGETTGTNSFRDMFIATKVGPGKLTLGQFKPLRSMEELTSSNEITMIERPYASASGIFSGRQFAIGAKYDGASAAGNVTWGLAVQNNSVLKGTDSRITEEPNVSARFTYAPIMAEGSVVHLGLSGSMENGDSGTGARLRGRGKLPSTDLGTSRTLAEAGAAGDKKDASHIGLELAGVAGPFYAQAEYIMASYSDAFTRNGAAEDADVDAYYMMASWLVTGESKPYSKGVFKSPKPQNAYGAWELKVRYDVAENKDQPTTATNERKLSAVTVGANWYVNPNVRFMLEYSMAKDETTQTAGQFVEPEAVTLRTQFSF